MSTNEGRDIVLYYSAEIKLSDCKPYVETGILDGAFFVNGLFFAHDVEHVTYQTGTTEPLQKGKSKSKDSKTPQEWER
jgi:hypothetical protein